MSTVAFDGKFLAADSQGTVGTFPMYDAIKVRRVKDKLVGFAGDLEDGDTFCKWLEKPKTDFPENLEKDFDNIVIEDGKAFHYTRKGGKETRPTPWAIGSGGEIALGMMLAGKTAEQAVEATRQYDIYTGGEVRILEVPHERLHEK